MSINGDFVRGNGKEGIRRGDANRRNPPKVGQKKAKANLTDSDSHIMKTSSGYIQGYNAQAAVGRGQIIIAADVTQEANDVHQLHRMTEKAQEELKTVEIEEGVSTELADAGYWSEDNIVNLLPTDPEFLVATTKDWKQRKAINCAARWLSQCLVRSKLCVVVAHLCSVALKQHGMNGD